VVGVGGGGSNAVNRMIEDGLGGVEFIAVNTDVQALALSSAPLRVAIGKGVTGGLGSGGDPAVGAKAAEESREEMRSVLEDADMVFVTAGLGGGTGTGGAPIVAEIARDMGALTVAVVTRPFAFEGARKARVAEEWLKSLAAEVDALIVIHNERLLELVDKNATMVEAFRLADDVLRQGVKGVAEVITTTGDINTDFADVRTIMAGGGTALMAIGRASGDERALAAAQQATTNPLLDISMRGAKGVLYNIKGGPDLSIHEINQAAELIRQTAAPDANIIWGTLIDEDMRDQIEITVIATGFGSGEDADTTATVEATSDADVQGGMPMQRLFDKGDLDIPIFLRRSKE